MGGERLKIVHVLRAPVGGLFRHVIDLSAAQAAEGHAVGIFFDESGRDARVDAALARPPGGFGLGVGSTAIPRDPRPADLAAFWKFRRFLAAARPDVVHGHGSKGGLYARLARLIRLPGDPVIAYTLHGGSVNHREGSFAHRLNVAVERALKPATDLYLFESQFIAGQFARYCGAPKGLARVVWNGLQPDEFAPIVPDADAFDLLFIGELRFAKGVDTLIAALKRLKSRERGPPRLALVGAGPDRAAFERQAAELGLSDRIAFLGPLPARQALPRGRICVLPSRQESLPYIVMETAAASAPLIACNAGGIAEIFGPYADRLAPPSDAAALARRIDAVLDQDAATREKEAAELRDYVGEHFSLARMAQGVMAAYLAARSARRPEGSGAPVGLNPR